KCLRDLKPDQFADLIAMNALYRPGPLAYIPNFINRKHGREAIAYDLPEMEEYLAETYGITVYQEQVMLLSQKLANFSKGDADVLRKAMGKKDRKTLDKMKSQFISGAKSNGHPENILDKIWTDWEAFAQYAFNKSHSTCYAFVAYQTAYLKAHYPAEYMSAVLNNAGSIDKITFFMEECKRMGLPVLGPDINESVKGFAVNKAGEIRFGLGGLKGVGEAAVEAIIHEREKKGAFSSIFDFIKRTAQRSVNKKTLENLVYAGTFDGFAQFHRAQYFYTPPGETATGLERVIKYGQVMSSQNAGSSHTLFGDLQTSIEIPEPRIPDCAPWPLTEQLNYEKEVTGMFLSGHPLDHYRFEMRHYGITSIADFNEFKDSIATQPNQGRIFRLITLVTVTDHRNAQNGNKYGRFTLEDYSGKTEVSLFREEYLRLSPLLALGTAVYITGSFRQRFNNGDYEFKISTVSLAETLKKTLTRQLHIHVHPRHLTSGMIDFVEKNIRHYRGGNTSMRFTLAEPDINARISLTSGTNGFEMNDPLIAFLEEHPEMEVQVATGQ
ncbi:MAG TPA: DNA polymerase III subunit alpha, partial [Chitinophagaceae bacterium]|nr:DNA polymerase III subunit alpha [Chitinophagaceae bacterium]